GSGLPARRRSGAASRSWRAQCAPACARARRRSPAPTRRSERAREGDRHSTDGSAVRRGHGRHSEDTKMTEQSNGSNGSNGRTGAEAFALKVGLAEMLKGGVIMDVTTPEQARIAEDAGAAAVMALERVPA